MRDSLAPLIRKIFQSQPEVYRNTERICLVSFFMASLLIGRYAFIDQTDGSGMNMMDIKQRARSAKALEVYYIFLVNEEQINDMFYCF